MASSITISSSLYQIRLSRGSNARDVALVVCHRVSPSNLTPQASAQRFRLLRARPLQNLNYSYPPLAILMQLFNTVVDSQTAHGNDIVVIVLVSITRIPG